MESEFAIPAFYSPLDQESREIRILEILPEPHPLDGRTQCYIHIKSLLSNPGYDSLSYAWGLPDDCNFKIWIAQSEEEDILVSVRRNLLCALRVLRANGVRMIGIDALCIDQNNMNEKGHQVEMMGDIYRNARRVLSWLGTPDQFEMTSPTLDTAREAPVDVRVQAFDLLEDICSRYNNWINSEKMHRRIDYPSYSWTKHLHYLTWWENSFVSDAAFGSHFSHLVSLCYEEYWGRLWIIQEVCLARNLQILRGRRMLDWEKFHTYRMIISIADPQRADYLSNLLTRVSRFIPNVP